MSYGDFWGRHRQGLDSSHHNLQLWWRHPPMAIATTSYAFRHGRPRHPPPVLRNIETSRPFLTNFVMRPGLCYRPRRRTSRGWPASIWWFFAKHDKGRLELRKQSPTHVVTRGHLMDFLCVFPLLSGTKNVTLRLFLLFIEWYNQGTYISFGKKKRTSTIPL